MRRFIGVAALFALMFAAAGCVDLEQEYTINPDGSGKVVVHWIGAPFNLGPAKTPEAQAQSLLKDEITKCEGVDAWKDLSCTARDDGKFEFKGTAYFKDLARLKLHNQGFSMLVIKSSKDAAGNLVIVNEMENKKAAADKPLTEEEAKKKLKEERAKYQQGKRFVESMLADLKAVAKLNLPGKVGAATNFKKVSDNSVRITLDGKAFMKVLDDVINNDELMLKHLKEKGSLDAAPTDEAFNEKIFGEKGPVRATTTGALAALFDYEKEAGPARKEFEEIAKKMGGGPIGPPAKGGDFKSLKVAGVRHVYEADMERGLMPLGQHQPGMSISLLGDLPGTVLGMKEGKLKKAVADTGDDLLPEEFQRSIHWVQLGKDKASVAFDVNLAAPGAKVKGLKEVSGVLTYLVGGKTKAADLGITEFKTGAKGTQFGSTVTKVEDNSWQEGHQNLELTVGLSRDMIASVVVQDESGSALKTMEGGSMSSGEETTLTFTIKGKFPAKGKIKVEVYEDLKTFEIPFKIENVDLLGRPAK